MFPLTPYHVLTLAKIVKAVQGGKVVRWHDGPNLVQGVLRSFSNGDGRTAHFTGDDVRQAWIRVTMREGYDRWLEVVDLVVMLEDGAASVG